MTIADNIQAIHQRIEVAATRSNRDPASVRLIGVTKGVEPARVREAIDAGLADFGENFVQEAEARITTLDTVATSARWHFIGHLQSNKITAALNLFDIIQSVDSLRLAEQISRRADAKIRVLLEVNVAQEASKFGFAPAEVSSAIDRVSALENLDLDGLMTVAPAGLDADLARPVFRSLRELAAANGLKELSMGMTDDFEVAIEEGATMVRIGRAIFGERLS